MFEKRRDIRQANRRHGQLMRIADRTVEWRFGPIADGELAELAAIFIGRVFGALHETVDAAEAANYLTAALARRGIAIPASA